MNRAKKVVCTRGRTRFIAPAAAWGSAERSLLGTVVGAFALELLGHRDHGGGILMVVKDDGDRCYALAGFRHLVSGELAGGYCLCEGAGGLLLQESRGVQILALVVPYA